MTAPSQHPPISTGLRLGAMLLDHFFMCVIAMLFFLPGFIISFSNSFSDFHETDSTGLLGGPGFYAGLFGFALYFCKDVVNGRSLAKRILKLQVAKNGSGEVASPMQCFIRNLLCVIWPVEVIMVLVNPQRRLGDLLAGTQVVPYDATADQPRPGIIQLLLPVGLAYGAMLLLAQGLGAIEPAAPKYSASSINPAAAIKLEQLLNDSLGQYGTADVKVYDSIHHSKLRYVSVIIRLQHNYLADESQSPALLQKTEQLIYTELPRHTISGSCKFIFRRPGQMQSAVIPVGTAIIEH